MSRNEHARTPLHHAAAMNRPAIARLLARARRRRDATDDDRRDGARRRRQEGATRRPRYASGRRAPRSIFTAALNLGRYDLAEAMLRDDPARIGPDGRDTIALHLWSRSGTPSACAGSSRQAST